MAIAAAACGLDVRCFAQSSPPTSAGAPISPDGSTATKAKTGASGRIAVSIAPADASGTSLNRYQQFGVPKSGADLDNSIVQARLIINEVTGSTKTSVLGDLNVLGRKAHVIVANPNGVAVDGGGFVNASAVVLTTGRISLNAEGAQIATDSGRIDVLGGGLSSDGARLDLIAKEIGVSGPINAGGGDLSATAGSSIHQAKAAASLDTGAGLLRTDDASGSSRAGVAIDVSNPATINGGSIRLVVTDAGAGVKFAANATAGAGGFVLGAKGGIRIEDATVASSGSVSIYGSDVSVTSANARSVLTSSQGGVSLRSMSGKIAVAGAKIRGVTRDNSSFAPLGGVAFDSAQDLTIQASDLGGRTDLAASADGVALTAKGKIVATGLTLSSAGTLIASARDSISLSDVGGATSAASFLSALDVALRDVDLTADNGVKFQGASVSLVSASTKQSVVRSLNAGVTIVSRDGDVSNNGAKVQGYSTTHGDTDSSGAISIVSARDIVNRSVDSVRKAELVADAGRASLKAVGAIRNWSGTILSGSGVDITAGTDLINETVVANPEAAVLSTKTRFGGLVSSSSLNLNYGDLVAGSARATISAGDNLTVHAVNIDNFGGVIEGAKVSVDAFGTVQNNSILSGKGYYKRSCFVFCTSKGGMDVKVIEARISASDTLQIRSASRIQTTGAFLAAGNNADVSAPQFAALALLTPMIVLRPAGIAGLFRGQDGWAGYGYDGGFVGSYYGSFTAKAEDIQIEGVSISAKEKNYSSTPRLLQAPTGAGPALSRDVGILAKVLR